LSLPENVMFGLIKRPFQVQMFARHKDMVKTSPYVQLAIVFQKSDKDEWTTRAVKTVGETIELVR